MMWRELMKIAAHAFVRGFRRLWGSLKCTSQLTVQLLVERLEDRLSPAVIGEPFKVKNTSAKVTDENSLPWAIAQVNSQPPPKNAGDTYEIEFDIGNKGSKQTIKLPVRVQRTPAFWTRSL